jgi:hypothetical protein
MDSLYSKAFWLGRCLSIISYVKAGGGDTPENTNLVQLRRMAEGFSKALNLQIQDIPGLKTPEDFTRLREAVRNDLQAIQSRFVSQCFAFGYDYSAWINLRGGYDEHGQMRPEQDFGNVEPFLRREAGDIGLLPEWEHAVAAAKNPGLDNNAFNEKTAIDILTQMEGKLDIVDPARVSSAAVPKGTSLFIVMPMIESDPALEDVLDTIENTAKALGLEANRVDQLEDSGRITDSIVDGLKKSAYVVVDLTHARPNVYWEAGFTHGLGKIPIYIARKGTTLEFDVKDYPVIYFANNKSLGERLMTRLRQLMDTKEAPAGVKSAGNP